jgi:predicted small secreted protein
MRPAGWITSWPMRLIILIIAALALNSCNTFIGIGRDTKQGYQWTKSKFQGSGGGGGDTYDEGAPVY